MNTFGRSTDSPFRARADPDLDERRRPAVDDETMQRLRTPFVTQPAGHGVRDEDTPDHERPDRRPRGGGDRG